MSELEDLINKTARFYRPSTPEEVRKVFDYLDAKLHGFDLDGKVVSVLVRDMNNHRINHYHDRTTSLPIPYEVFHREFNLSIGGKGTKVMGTIATPETHRMYNAYKKGYLVRRIDLGQETDKDPPFDGQYIALVNIPLELGDYTYVIHSFNPRLD